MRQPVLAVVAVGLVLLGLLGVAGCGGSPGPVAAGGAAVTRSASASATGSASPSDPDDPAAGSSTSPSTASPSPSSSPSPDRAALLRSAAARTAATSFRFTLGNGVRHVDGEYDATNAAVDMSQTTDGQRTTVAVFGDEMLLSGLAPDGSVLRVDATRLPASSELMLLATPLLALRLMGGAGRVESTGDESYSGRIDLNKIDATGLPTISRFVAFLAKQAGDRAGDVGFTATVDAAGRLVGFRATFPRADAGEDLRYELSVVEAGEGVTVARPAGVVVEAPASLYQP